MTQTQDYRDHAVAELLVRFPRQTKIPVLRAFRRAGKLYIPSVRDLSGQPDRRVTVRVRGAIQDGLPALRTNHCMELLKEKKYLELERSVADLTATRQRERAALMEAATAQGLLEDCCCCFGEGFLREDMCVWGRAPPLQGVRVWGCWCGHGVWQ